MKKMKLSTRLYASFGAIIILLAAIIVTEVVSLNTLMSRKDRLINAQELNEAATSARRFTLGYFATASESEAENVGVLTEDALEHITEGFGLYKVQEDIDIISTIQDDINAYYDSFLRYKGHSDSNEELYNEMANNADIISEILNQMLAAQQENSSALLEETAVLDKKSIDIVSITEAMNRQQTKLYYVNDSIISLQGLRMNELRYILKGDTSHDKDVYSAIDKLRSNCIWLSENFEKQEDKILVQQAQDSIEIFIDSYESYKGLLEKENEEEIILHDLAFKITDATNIISEGQEALMNKDMQQANIVAVSLGIISAIIGILLAFLIVKSLVKTLTSNMDQLSNSAALVSSASLQLSVAGQKLSEGSTEQAAAIEETSATMDETSSMVQQNAENTRQANSLSSNASSAAAMGAEKMLSMAKSMDELKKSSNEISNIIKVIDDIAFQTNMLALNAAVEAARAGDAGQGFAVVAEEVRNLAQKSAKAASDTVEIIDNNIELSNQGVVLTEEVKNALNEILEKTESVNTLMAEITAASDEQSRGTNQVNQAISEMEKVVQENAATAEESAASAEELQSQAQALEAIVDDLEIMIKGRKSSSKDHAKSESKYKEKNSKKSKKSKRVISSNDIIPLDNEDDF